jgi:site-specific DNA recombinase
MTRTDQSAKRNTLRQAGSANLASPGARVAVYLRISTDEEHQPFSLEAQRHRLEAFIPTQPGWVQVATYEDQVSGAKAARPGLDRALRDARLGRYDVLLVYRVDRFARSLKVLVGLLEELEAVGVAFRSATEPIDTSTATGRMLVQLLGVFAEFERATIIDRVINGMERKAARGGWPGGTLPYGLALDADKRLESAPGELALVERVFARYATGTVGAATIANELNDDGLRTRSGRRWTRQVILDLLRNRTYLGEVYFRGTWHRSAPFPFIDPATFDRVQGLLNERGEGYARRFATRSPEYLLTGLVKCAKCQRNYVGVSARGRSQRYRYYTCWTRNRYGAEACDADQVRADQLEEAVMAALVDLYADPGALREAAMASRHNDAAAASRTAADIAAVGSELSKAEAAIERYMLAFENGTVTEEMFGQRVRELGNKAATLRARRAELTDALDAAGSAEAPVTDEAVSAIYQELCAVSQAAPDPIRKAVAQAFVHELNVRGRDCIEPTFRLLPGLPDLSCTAVPEGGPKDGVRTMTAPVGAEGLEPPTCWL